MGRSVSPEGKEVKYAHIKSRADPTTFYVSDAEPTKDGISWVGSEVSQVIGKSKVTLSKGGETATLEFDQANLHAAPPQGVPASVRAPAGTGQQVLAAPVSGMIAPANGGRGGPVIPRPVIMGPAQSGPVINPQAAGAHPGATNTPDIKRRVRLINNSPGPR